jgi:hypothetical protein
MSLDILVETLLEMEKIIRGFLWKGRGDLHGGHYLWDRQGRIYMYLWGCTRHQEKNNFLCNLAIFHHVCTPKTMIFISCGTRVHPDVEFSSSATGDRVCTPKEFDGLAIPNMDE